MWIVRLALRRPYTFVVASLLALILGVVTILRMPVDIFPQINIPVIAVAFNYSGMTPDDMEARIVSGFEKILTVTVSDIEHVESTSLNGICVVKVFFYPGANIATAMSQVSAISQTATRNMPPGIQPPLMVQYSASDVPILQLGLESDTSPEQEVFDLGNTVLRPKINTVQGAHMPYPYGGKQPQVMVDIDPARLYAWGISPSEVSAALGQQNIIVPSGTVKIGTQEYPVHINSSPRDANAINNMPVKTVHGIPVFMKDIGSVRMGSQVQTSMVHSNGKRGGLMVIYKAGNASTLDVVDRIKAVLPEVQKQVPPGKNLKVTPLFDQSIFVRASVNGVVREAAIAAGLTALMILIFLGSWRSTLIVCISIPLSILVSIIVLSFLGDTLNVMTLGGMALAVGILVDDATVEIENIHRNIHMKKRLVQAILDGASQIAVPAFVSTLCICIVFVPVVFISGTAKYLFTPLAMAVVFAMLTSYLLSRTLVPTMVHYLLASEVELYGGEIDPNDPHAHAEKHAAQKVSRGIIWHCHDLFNAQFEKLRRFYGGLLALALQYRFVVLVLFAVFVVGSCFLLPLVGEDFFPTVDAGQIRLHVRLPDGTRLEESERVFGQVEEAIRTIIPKDQIVTLLDNIGIPNSSINLCLSDCSLISPADGEILISLSQEHAPTEQYINQLAEQLHKKFPREEFFFMPSDIVTQVLNFGIQSPVDIQVDGPVQNRAKNYEIARKIQKELAVVPGAADVHLAQVNHTPDLRVDVDRTLASEAGVTQQQVANDMLISLSGTAQQNPNWWLNTANLNQYGVLVQTPQYRIDSMNTLSNQPIIPSAAAAAGSSQGDRAELLGNLSQISRGYSATNITHYQFVPTFDVQCGVRGMDLGSVSNAVDRILAKYKPDLARGSSFTVRGQVQSMKASFQGLSYGLIFAIVLVYLLMVINFQSWLDPLIILMALPGALAGILWMLFVTQTTISVPSLMGAIMSIGVATSNSILMITFANDQRKAGMNAHDAALSAGITRLRPVIMTAAAMIIGMLPMALGLGEGGEQNAPLGRAVIGGLTVATFATLFFVPVVYSKMRFKAAVLQVEKELQ